MIHSIDLRFRQPSFKAYKQLESLLLKALEANDFADELEYLKLHYNGDIDAFTLLSQLRLLPVMFKEDIVNIVCFDDVLQKVKQLPPAESSHIENVITICKLLHVNPATSVTGERSFSLARRLKTMASIEYDARTFQQSCNSSFPQNSNWSYINDKCCKRIPW